MSKAESTNGFGMVSGANMLNKQFNSRGSYTDNLLNQNHRTEHEKRKVS